jgi:dipeptidyl aminopeptidase/acylaminoacyl peptidase
MMEDRNAKYRVATMTMMLIMGCAISTRTVLAETQGGTKMNQNAATKSATTNSCTALPPIISREVLFGNPEKARPQMSPDGKYLAYLAPDEKDVLQVWVRTLGKEDDRKITSDKKRGIRSYFWPFDKTHLLYEQDSDGDENWHIYSVDLGSNLVRDLTPFVGARAEIVAGNYRYPETLLVGLNIRDQRFFDVYTLNLKTGALEMKTENPGSIISWEADTELMVRAALTATADGGHEMLVRKAEKDEWKSVLHWGPDEDGGPVLFSEKGETLYFMSSLEANATRLMAYDMESGRISEVAGDENYDVDNLAVQPITRKIQAVSFYKAKRQWEILDPAIKPDFAAIEKIHGGEFMITDRDLSDKSWIVAYDTDDGPVYYYLYDKAARTGTFLFVNKPKLKDLKLARMEPVEFEARDGLEIHGYLSTPPCVEAKHLPTVLLVHGGPWARDQWGYDPEVQWLTNRGYAVLQINFRGSTGYGKKFLAAGNREWAGKMHDDLIDGVKWLTAKGIADPKRIAIMGGSYGGYATLVGLTFTPEVFAAGVDIVGPSNILTLMKSIPPYWEPMRAAFEHRVGKMSEEEFLKSRSPLFFVDKICVPLLIGQGANDPRVKQAEAEQIVEAMRKAKKPVEYVLYPDEGHGFARPENRMQFFAIAEEFLAKYLGGRCEPVSEVKGATGVVKDYPAE